MEIWQLTRDFESERMNNKNCSSTEKTKKKSSQNNENKILKSKIKIRKIVCIGL